ncbi:MAG: hypothetical protein [Cressdnaviricota sp.]|nr:MAG: hypothetical protein [Cressdnaviricota sp.]
MPRRRRESDEDYIYISSEEENRYIDTRRRNKRRNKGKLPDYDWVMGEILATEHLPTYVEAMEEKIKESNIWYHQTSANILEAVKNINDQVESLMIMKQYWIKEYENLNDNYNKLIEKYKTDLKDVSKKEMYEYIVNQPIKGWGRKHKIDENGKHVFK